MSSPARATPSSLFLMYVDGADARRVPIDVLPFTIGRADDKHLKLQDARASRNHAMIVRESDGYYVVDQQSRRGTYVNGERVERRLLRQGDRVHFGARDGVHIIFGADRPGSSASELLTQAAALQSSRGELAALNALLEVAQKLNSSTVLEDVIITVLDKAIQVTKAERGFMFLRELDGTFRVAAGRNRQGATLRDDSEISQSILREASDSGRDFVVTEEDDSSRLLGRHSVEQLGLQSVICIPLRHRHSASADAGQVYGVLYLDSRAIAGRLSAVEHGVLHSLAGEVAMLVENASLLRAKEQARRYEQELSLANAIQLQLMAMSMPEVPFGQVRAHCVPCHHIGGDFYDVVWTPNAISVVLADISGKGISAALLASALQGLAYSQLKNEAPLVQVAATLHAFLCEKQIGEKYATLLLMRLNSSGMLELVNCGHPPPLLVSQNKVSETATQNPPVGLWPDAKFESEWYELAPGDRLLSFTDGVTEASTGEQFFGSERVSELAARGCGAEQLVNEVRTFCADQPLQDDCTALEITFTRRW